MQPDDPSITPPSTAASATAFRIFLVLFVIGHAFLRIQLPWHPSTVGHLIYSGHWTRVQYFVNHRNRFARPFLIVMGSLF